MTDRDNEPISTGYIPSGRGLPEARRNFRLTDKRRIVAEASAPGVSVSAVARRYGIAPRLVFRWKRELAAPQGQIAAEPVFLSVAVSGSDGAAKATSAGEESRGAPSTGRLVVEQAAPDIEIELVGGRRLRFAKDIDPQTVHAMVALLEGAGS
jgi:transposase